MSSTLSISAANYPPCSRVVSKNFRRVQFHRNLKKLLTVWKFKFVNPFIDLINADALLTDHAGRHQGDTEILLYTFAVHLPSSTLIKELFTGVTIRVCQGLVLPVIST